MNTEKFSNWFKWEKRNNAENIKFPGIYILAVSTENLDGKTFDWLSDVKYVGMTNSVAGLKGRLKQFDNTIIGKTGHGGADRFRYKYQNYDELIQKLYVSVVPFIFDVKSNSPQDLRTMGEVAKFEYDCFARYVELYGQLPKFNDKKNSPKHSLTYGRNKAS